MQIHRGALTLLLGLALLTSGPILLRLAPDLLPSDSATPWTIPSSIRTNESPSYLPYGVQISGIETQERLTLTSNGEPFVFQRFSFSVTSFDKDLVPWFSQSWRGWVRQNYGKRGGDRRVQVTFLERPSGTGGAVSVVSFKVGPYVVGGFSSAKLLQIPAKLLGFNTLDVVAVTMECARDCDVKAERATGLLEQVLDANSQPARSRW